MGVLRHGVVPEGRSARRPPGRRDEPLLDPQARAIRVRGPVEEATREETEADLAGRSPAARALVAPGDWRVWRLRPDRVEFWQGSPDRNHLRIVYTRAAADQDSPTGWSVEVSRAAG